MAVGGNANFTVTATGTAPLSYQWRFNGGAIAGAITNRLALTNVQPADAGNYTVVVTNSGGSVTSAVAVLTVLVPPAISAQPQSLTNVAGTTASFSATATGTAPLSYQWRLNGLNLSNGGRVSGAGTDTLTVTNVQPVDAGNYALVVSNAGGAVTSAVAVLIVTGPPVITTPPASQNAAAGANIAFNVTASGTMPLSFQWRFIGADLSDGGQFGGTSTPALSVANVQPANAGSYSVVVTNVAGSVTSAVATLTVLLPPVITAQPQSLTNVTGSTATFSATATGSVPLSYRWQFNGGSLTNGGRLSGATTNTLGIASVQAADAGNYALVVSNAVGVVTSAVANLTVLVPPVITVQPGSQSVVAGNDVSFSVAASGTLPLSYQWLLNGAPLAEGGQFNGVTSPTLFMRSVQAANAAGYSVIVTNVAGAVTSAVATLTITVPGSCSAVPAGLVGWWPAEGSALDIAGSNSGTLQGGATATAVGEVGLSFGLNGTSAYVQIPDSPALRPTNFTVEAWVMFTSLDSTGNSLAGQQYIVFKQNTRSSNFEGIYLAKERRTGGDIFVFGVSSAAGQGVEVDSAPMITPGVWYHLAGMRGSNFIQLYVNGQFVGQTSVSFPQDYGNFPLYFGTSGQSYWDHKFAGLLDEVSLYNRALSAAEIAAIYTAGTAGKCQGPQVPVVLLQPQNQSLVVGSSAVLTVTATGTTPLAYQWQRNGTNLTNAGNIAGATSSALSLVNVQLSDTANYRVVITNLLGSATSVVAVLTVTPAPVAPSITSQPVSQLLVVGGTATFNVTAAGTAPLGYQWRKNGGNLVNGGRISGATSPSLILANVQTNDAGNYQVVVTNSGGSVTSLVASLSSGAPPLNNAFANAQAISGSSGSVLGATLNATKETGEPDHVGNPGGASVWYTWTAPSSSPATFDTAYSDFDTLLAIYTGNAVNGLVLVAGNDNLNVNSACSRTTFIPTAGTVYKIAVDGANGASGNPTLRWVQASVSLPDLLIVGSAVNPTITTETFAPSSCAVVEGLIQSGTRRIIRFNTQTANLGNADLVLGNPASNPQFEYAACHGHYHLQNYMAYRLRDTNGVAVGLGQKVGFCILDVTKVSPNGAANPKYTCTSQGIQVGWSDVYDSTLDGQWVDITGVPNGSYLLELEVNPFGVLLESDYSKNLTYVPIVLGPSSAAPPNDTFANATALVGGSVTVSGTTLNATKQSGEPNHAGNAGGHSIWYQWTAPSTKSVIVDTVGSGFDTLLAVYTGTAVNGLTLVASKDDISNPTNLQSRVTFSATAGTVYRIAVDGFNGAAGNIFLTINQTLANDSFTGYVFLGGSSGSIRSTDVGATKEPGEPNHAGNPGGHSIWYRWTAPLDGTATFNTTGSTFDTLLAVYIGTVLTNLSLVASNDDIAVPGNPRSQVTFGVTVGTQFAIAIDGHNGDSGNTVLNWSVVVGAAAPAALTRFMQPLNAPATVVASPPVLIFAFSAGGEGQLTVTGLARQRYRIEVSDDLAHWAPLGDALADDSGHAYFTDKNAVLLGGPRAAGVPATANSPSTARFYRTVNGP